MKQKNKKYSSIVFITTLSVYLGLVLAGGAAPVLAHSALTKEFDIRNEIVIQDDLENKPDDDLLENGQEDFPKILSEFLIEAERSSKADRLQSPFPLDFQSAGFIKYYKVSEKESAESGGVVSGDSITNFCSRFIYGTILPNALKAADYKDFYENGKQIGQIKQAEAKIRADKSDLIFEISFNKSASDVFADFLNANYLAAGKNAEEKRLKDFYENTKISSENNQVFIVTRLPRASIDSLLKK